MVLSFFARFDGWQRWPTYAPTLRTFFLLAIPAQMAVLVGAGIYRRAWRLASVVDLELLASAIALASAVTAFIGVGVLPLLGLPRAPIGVVVIDIAMFAGALALPRFGLRVLLRRQRLRTGNVDRQPVLIVGAGQAGSLVVKDLHLNPQWGLQPVGFVDDDRSKQGLRIHGIPVLGRVADLACLAAEYGAKEAIIAIPSAPGRVIREIVRQASSGGVKTRTVPGLFELLTGRTSVGALRPVEIQDLLRRDHVETSLAGLRPAIAGRVVLVTGAGGSIGSELCRQIAQLDPAALVILGRGENSIFEIQQELARTQPTLNVHPVIADVRDAARMEQVFDQHRPTCVFHAAAHKHVPLMENSIAEAVLNNVLGTRNVASMAAAAGCERFVLISTDKAVRPTSIMGASKRIAEQLVNDIAIQSGRAFVSVRFGNVLGSRGSVVPTFLKQIAAGGPVTITHPEMSRYFMTIPEAVHLVLQASVLGHGSDVFVLDMGEPVKIVDLASDLIRLSGLEVGSDIEIRFTGARPGEKLYEELFFDDANANPTTHPKIRRARESTVGTSTLSQIDALIAAAQRHRSNRELRRMIRALVPDYQGQRDSEEMVLHAAAGARAVGAFELLREPAAKVR